LRGRSGAAIADRGDQLLCEFGLVTSEICDRPPAARVCLQPVEHPDELGEDGDVVPEGRTLVLRLGRVGPGVVHETREPAVLVLPDRAQRTFPRPGGTSRQRRFLSVDLVPEVSEEARDLRVLVQLGNDLVQARLGVGDVQRGERHLDRG
jgi:hypothetical protein